MFESYKRVLTNLPEYSKNVFRKGYFKWLLGQVKGWNKILYLICIVNFIMQCAILIPALLNNTGAISIVAAIAGFMGANLSVLCVCSISARSALNGFTSITSAMFIITAACISHNWATVAEQLFFMFAMDFWVLLDPMWNKDIKAREFSKASEWFKYLGIFILAYIVIYFVFSYTNDPNLIPDSLVLSVSVVASLLEFNRYKEQYVFWLIGNVANCWVWVASWLSQGTATPALLVSYSLFFLNSLTGMYLWYKEARTLRNK